MYSDPSQIRSNTIKVSLNESEAALVDAYCAYTGKQKAAFVRELILAAAQRSLFGDGAANGLAMEGPNLALKSA